MNNLPIIKVKLNYKIKNIKIQRSELFDFLLKQQYYLIEKNTMHMIN